MLLLLEMMFSLMEPPSTSFSSDDIFWAKTIPSMWNLNLVEILWSRNADRSWLKFSALRSMFESYSCG